MKAWKIEDAETESAGSHLTTLRQKIGVSD